MATLKQLFSRLKHTEPDDALPPKWYCEDGVRYRVTYVEARRGKKGIEYRIKNRWRRGAPEYTPKPLASTAQERIALVGKWCPIEAKLRKRDHELIEELNNQRALMAQKMYEEARKSHDESRRAGSLFIYPIMMRTCDAPFGTPYNSLSPEEVKSEFNHLSGFLNGAARFLYGSGYCDWHYCEYCHHITPDRRNGDCDSCGAPRL